MISSDKNKDKTTSLVTKITKSLIIKNLKTQPYKETLLAMKNHTKTKRKEDPNEIWILEHPNIYTRGLLSKTSDIRKPLPYPIINTDRGGQITFHGPGQIICYFLIHIDSTKNIITLLKFIEQSLINILLRLNINASKDVKSRGIYVQNHKIASIGLRIKNNCSYHGFSLNHKMDLSPFDAINPCGKEQKMTQIHKFTSIASNNLISICIQELEKQWQNYKNSI